MLTNANKGTYLVKKLQKYANVIYERSLIWIQIKWTIDHDVFHNYKKHGACTGKLTLYPAFRQNFVGVQFM